MPDTAQKGTATHRDDHRAAEGDGPRAVAAPVTDNAFDFTITLAGAGIDFNTAEVVSVTQRFDLQNLKTVTDVEIRLRQVAPAEPGEA
jgi:hypothetical protein